MPYAFFKVRANDDGGHTDELNRFLRSHCVLAVRNEWVAAGEDSFWAFCVDYLDRPSSKDSAKSGSNRIDYKEVLPPEQFAVKAPGGPNAHEHGQECPCHVKTLRTRNVAQALLPVGALTWGRCVDSTLSAATLGKAWTPDQQEARMQHHGWKG